MQSSTANVTREPMWIASTARELGSASTCAAVGACVAGTAVPLSDCAPSPCCCGAMRLRTLSRILTASACFAARIAASCDARSC